MSSSEEEYTLWCSLILNRAQHYFQYNTYAIWWNENMPQFIIGCMVLLMELARIWFSVSSYNVNPPLTKLFFVKRLTNGIVATPMNLKNKRQGLVRCPGSLSLAFQSAREKTVGGLQQTLLVRRGLKGYYTKNKQTNKQLDMGYKYKHKEVFWESTNN